MLLSAVFTLIGIAAVLFLLRFIIALEADGRSAQERSPAHLESFYTYRPLLADAARNSTTEPKLVQPRRLWAFSEASGLHKRNSHFMGA
jgi:hypothetical protein